MLRLVDLAPHWYCLEEGGLRVGLTFECPHCRTQRLGVTFHEKGQEAITDPYIHAHSDAKFIWTKTGDSFENLTLFPSVDASKTGHWHGWITNGEIR